MPTGVYKRTKKGGMFGKKHSEESKQKNRQRHIGKKYPNRKPHIISEETRKKMSDMRKGEKSHFWRGGITPINKIIRYSLDFAVWRDKVFIRDNYTCKKYGTRGGELHAHHILNFASNPELRFDIDNGITLSKNAHYEFHNRYGWENNTVEQLSEFLNENL